MSKSIGNLSKFAQDRALPTPSSTCSFVTRGGAGAGAGGGVRVVWIGRRAPFDCTRWKGRFVRPIGSAVRGVGDFSATISTSESLSKANSSVAKMTWSSRRIAGRVVVDVVRPAERPTERCPSGRDARRVVLFLRAAPGSSTGKSSRVCTRRPVDERTLRRCFVKPSVGRRCFFSRGRATGSFLRGGSAVRPRTIDSKSPRCRRASASFGRLSSIASNPSELLSDETSMGPSGSDPSEPSSAARSTTCGRLSSSSESSKRSAMSSNAPPPPRRTTAWPGRTGDFVRLLALRFSSNRRRSRSRASCSRRLSMTPGSIRLAIFCRLSRGAGAGEEGSSLSALELEGRRLLFTVEVDRELRPRNSGSS